MPHRATDASEPAGADRHRTLAAPSEEPGSLTDLQALVARQCREMQVSISHVAREAGMTRSSLYKLMDGSTRDPSVGTLFRLANALSLAPMTLFRLYAPQGKAPGLQTGASVVRSTVWLGDAVAFAPDLSVPDHSVVVPRERFVKRWSFQNVGTAPWVGRRLVRVERELIVAQRGCDGALEVLAHAHLASDVPEVHLPDHAPGTTCVAEIGFTAPDKPGSAVSVWRMVDRAGQPCFPPAFFLQAAVTVIGS
jgi:DNA-binding phage protein